MNRDVLSLRNRDVLSLRKRISKNLRIVWRGDEGFGITFWRWGVFHSVLFYTMVFAMLSILPEDGSSAVYMIIWLAFWFLVFLDVLYTWLFLSVALWKSAARIENPSLEALGRIYVVFLVLGQILPKSLFALTLPAFWGH